MTNTIDPPKKSAPLSRTLLSRVLREPLAHFAAIGLALYLLSTGFSASPDQQQIIIDKADIARIKSSYQQQFGTAPTAAQLQQLLEHWIREEIYWREGLALGLDRGDEIVRRRVAQKYEFLQQDMAIAAAPDDGELREYFQRNGARYTEPARVSFEQLFIAYDKDTDNRVEALAAQLQSAPRADTQALGDSFPGQTAVVAMNEKELIRLFGDSNIVRAAFSAPEKTWFGPVSSGYGQHFIRVTDKLEPQLPPLEAVEDQVRADYLEERGQTQNTAAYRELLAKYQVSVEADS